MHAMSRLAAVFLCATLLSCAPAKVPQTPPAIAPVTLSLVESEPVETNLDRPDIPDASAVWLEMVNGAKRSIDVAQFYASEAEPQWIASSKLTPIIDALVRAHERGVKVRFLVDEKFVPQYPGTIERLEKAGIEVRRIDGDAIFGGVEHAKYFIVDGFTSFIGSQNFDWRALGHIQEMGVRLHSTEFAHQLQNLFDTDWAIAGGASMATRMRKHPPAGALPGVEAQRVELVASPKGWLPNESSWDLPRIIALLDGAKQSIQLQVLKYKTIDRSGHRFTEIDDAIRRAAARGVKIRFIISEWGMKDPSIQALRELTPVVEVRVITIPKWSGGDIPFARVAHAKYLVVDENVAWIGTSNWEGDYFMKSRNVGVILHEGTIPKRLAKFFDENWTNGLVTPVLPAPAPNPSP